MFFDKRICVALALTLTPLSPTFAETSSEAPVQTPSFLESEEDLFLYGAKIATGVFVASTGLLSFFCKMRFGSFNCFRRGRAPAQPILMGAGLGLDRGIDPGLGADAQPPPPANGPESPFHGLRAADMPQDIPKYTESKITYLTRSMSKGFKRTVNNGEVKWVDDIVFEQPRVEEAQREYKRTLDDEECLRLLSSEAEQILGFPDEIQIEIFHFVLDQYFFLKNLFKERAQNFLNAFVAKIRTQSDSTTYARVRDRQFVLLVKLLNEKPALHRLWEVLSQTISHNLSPHVADLARNQAGLFWHFMNDDQLLICLDSFFFWNLLDHAKAVAQKSISGRHFRILMDHLTTKRRGGIDVQMTLGRIHCLNNIFRSVFVVQAAHTPQELDHFYEFLTDILKDDADLTFFGDTIPTVVMNLRKKLDLTRRVTLNAMLSQCKRR